MDTTEIRCQHRPSPKVSSQLSNLALGEICRVSAGDTDRAISVPLPHGGLLQLGIFSHLLTFLRRRSQLHETVMV